MHLACLRAVHSVEATESERCVAKGRLPWCSSPDVPQWWRWCEGTSSDVGLCYRAIRTPVSHSGSLRCLDVTPLRALRSASKRERET